MTLLVDRGRESVPPSSAPAAKRSVAIPLSWLLAGAVALLVALLAIWVARGPTAQDTARVPDDRASASAPSAAPLLLAPTAPMPTVPTPHPAPSAQAAPVTPAPHPTSKSPAASAVPRSADPFAPAPAPPPAATDANAKARQSIY
jgi:cytoskeletal protein RodZ